MTEIERVKENDMIRKLIVVTVFFCSVSKLQPCAVFAQRRQINNLVCSFSKTPFPNASQRLLEILTRTATKENGNRQRMRGGVVKSDTGLCFNLLSITMEDLNATAGSLHGCFNTHWEKEMHVNAP